MKHYYDDEGILAYDLDRKLLLPIAEALMPISRENFTLDRTKCLDAACSIIHSYSLHACFNGLGGCTPISEWRNEVPKDKLEAALKPLFFDFIDKGFVDGEFKMVAFDAACQIQIAYVM